MRAPVKFVIGGAALAIIAVGGLMALSVSLPYRGFSNDAFLNFEHGTGTAGMAHSLAEAGVIRYAWQFELERMLHGKAKLAAGEYRFEGAATVADVYDRIARGDVYHFDFTVPEGSNMFDIAQSLEAENIFHADDFLRAAANPAAIRDLAPHADTLEGYLFPSTYRLTHSTTPAGLCHMMTEQFRREWKKLNPAHDADVHRAVTLASLIEKETANPSERPLVASVFTNRLEKGMRLECDPTTIYAALLENRWHGVIHRSDLLNRNDYNTYQHAGLPPGPIANPGAPALAAALAPADTDYLFFVAKPGGGGHQFSSNLVAHDRAVKELRRGVKKVHKTG